MGQIALVMRRCDVSEAVPGCLADDPLTLFGLIGEHIPLGADPEKIQRFEVCFAGPDATVPCS